MQFLYATSASHREKPGKPAHLVIESASDLVLTSKTPDLCAVIIRMLLAKIL